MFNNYSPLVKSIFLTSLFLSITFVASAQFRDFQGEPLEITNNETLQETFRQYATFTLDIASLNDYVRSEDGISKIRLQWGTEQNWEMEIYPNNLFSADYYLRTSDENGTETTRPMTYEGHFSDNFGDVRLTIGDGYLFGMVEKNGQIFYIEPLNYFINDRPNNEFVMYEPSAVIETGNHTCGWSKKNAKVDEIMPSVENRNLVNNCYVVELAIASDFSMFSQFGSTAAVEAHNAAVMNIVQGDYRFEFDDNIEFKIVTQFVENTNAGTWTASTDAGTLLNDFRAWGEAGNFGLNFDLGQFWTTRDIADGANTSVIGLAYRPGICSSFKYHILELISGTSTTSATKRVLVSHEIGHNFGATHDGVGTAFIMAPSVNVTDDWSANSISQVSAQVATSNCMSVLADCSTEGTPNADFVTTSALAGCVGSAITYQDDSQYGATRNWIFAGATPASSTAKEVSVTYPTTGNYLTTIVSANGAGSSSESETVFVVIDNPPASPCEPSGAAGGAGISFFGFSNISNSSGNAATSGVQYEDFSCQIAELSFGQTYDLTITLGFIGGGNIFESFAFYIDYNDDGDFLDAGELAAGSGGSVFAGTWSPANGGATFQFTAPGNPALNSVLRARLITDNAFINSPCHTPNSGQVEDYGVVFFSPLPVILPIELTDFQATLRDETTLLNWETAAETNNDYFVVEHSVNSEVFKEIGRIEGAGTTDETTNYETIHQTPASGDNYYRLKQVDFDGSVSYSEIRTVFLDKTFTANLFPNPVSATTVSLEMNSKESGELQVDITNVAGQVMFSQAYNVVKGTNTQAISIADLSNGIYFLRLQKGQDVEMIRLVKN
jgi:hypothetical protein